MIAVRRLLSEHHRSAFSRECQRISEFHLLLAASHESCILRSLVCTVLRMLVKAVFLAADDWYNWWIL